MVNESVRTAAFIVAGVLAWGALLLWLVGKD
jgi:hypothetical protein